MWWNLYQDRYAKEVEQLRRHSPGIQIFRSQVPGRFCPSCTASPNTAVPHLAVYARISTRVGRHYPIIMVYSCNFPNRIPGVWTLNALDPRPPAHQYSDGRLCLTGNEFKGSVTGSIVLGWAYGWLNCYDIWRKTGKFPERNYGRHRV
jgi:hypothetical protein